MTDLIMKYLSVKGFPSYYMIDKKGNITGDDIPGFLSPELPEFLNKQLL